MSGRAPKQKGDRYERDRVNALQALGIFAERVPMSGAAGGSYDEDLIVAVQNEDWKVQCKVKNDRFGNFYEWLKTARAVFFKRDRDKTLVVMTFDDFARLARLSQNSISAMQSRPSEPSPKRASA